MIRLLKKILTLPVLRQPLLRLFVWIDNLCYRLITIIAVAKNNNVHPKHDILKYHDFFTTHLRDTDRVIDIGCGKGENAFDMAQKAKTVVGIDIEQNNIQKAAARYQRENLSYIVGDALVYPFDQTFDVIALSNVLEHIEDRVPFLVQLKKLAPTLLLRVPMINRDWLTVYKQQQGFEYRLDPTHYIEYTVDTLKKELDAAGWHVESYSIQFGEYWGVLTHDTQKHYG